MRMYAAFQRQYVDTILAPLVSANQPEHFAHRNQRVALRRVAARRTVRLFNRVLQVRRPSQRDAVIAGIISGRCAGHAGGHIGCRNGCAGDNRLGLIRHTPFQVGGRNLRLRECRAATQAEREENNELVIFFLKCFHA